MTSGGDITDDYAALALLYGEWAQGGPDRYALVAGGTVQSVVPALSEARRAVVALPDALTHALVVALQPLGGWRHPRFVIEAYRRDGHTAFTPPVSGDPLTRDFLLAESLVGGASQRDDLAAPYLLIKDGAVLGRYRRVTQARQVVDAALPPLAPVVFTSLRLGRSALFTVLVLQALVERLPVQG